MLIDMAAEIPRKVESGVKERVEVTRKAVGKEVEIVRTFVKDISTLKPVKAVIDLGIDTMDNLGDLIKDQARITREWME